MELFFGRRSIQSNYGHNQMQTMLVFIDIRIRYHIYLFIFFLQMLGYILLSYTSDSFEVFGIFIKLLP